MCATSRLRLRIGQRDDTTHITHTHITTPPRASDRTCSISEGRPLPTASCDTSLFTVSAGMPKDLMLSAYDASCPNTICWYMYVHSMEPSCRSLLTSTDGTGVEGPLLSPENRVGDSENTEWLTRSPHSRATSSRMDLPGEDKGHRRKVSRGRGNTGAG